MVNKKAFECMRKHMESFDELREEVILISRKVLKASKAAIYAAHRNDMAQADTLLKDAKANAKKVSALAKKDMQVLMVGAYGDALEEFAEASCYVHYLKKKELPTAEEIGVPVEVFLPALSDVVVELVRKAVNSAAQGDYATALEIKDVVSELYAELMLFDWRNSPARRKFDAIKYGLEKLEDLALKISLK